MKNFRLLLSKENLIRLKIQDNGRGFPEIFLKKMQSKDTKARYLLEKGSSKQAYASSDVSMPRLFGGAGIGLRSLIKQVLAGQKLDNDITFDNLREESGAVIVITTPLKPAPSFFISGSSIKSEGLENYPPRSFGP